MSAEKTKPSIALIDDDQFWAVGTIRELDKQFDVAYLKDAEEAVLYFEDKYDIDGIILDIMMPAPSDAEGETDEGHLTGIWILERIESFVVSSKIPVIVLTNHYDLPTVIERLKSIATLKSYITTHGKYGISRQELPSLVKARILAVKGMN